MKLPTNDNNCSGCCRFLTFDVGCGKTSHCFFSERDPGGTPSVQIEQIIGGKEWRYGKSIFGLSNGLDTINSLLFLFYDLLF